MLTALVLLLAATSSAHTVITYPGWRGDNLISNGTYPNSRIIPGSLGINWDNKAHEYTFPYGMQWMYPCGGMPTSTNRTKWPVTGGAVAIQPGHASGHETAFFYINVGLGTEPLNMSHPVVPVFQITGPSDNPYPGTFCLPQVPLPPGLTFKKGDNLTIQVVEVAVHGASLYNCVDVTLADPSEVEEVTRHNCFNSTGKKSRIGFDFVVATSSFSSGSSILTASRAILTILPLAAIFAASALFL